MNTFQTVILIALLGNTVLALLVLSSNPQRTLNRGFAVLATLIFLWLGSMSFGTLRLSQSALLFWTRQTSAFAGFIPLGIYLLYTVVANPGITMRSALYKVRYLVLCCSIIFVLCHSPAFIVSASYPVSLQTVPTIQYGVGFVFFILFFLAAIIGLYYKFRGDYQRSGGVQKEEFMFLQIGGFLGLVFGVSLLSAGVFFNRQEVAKFLPLSVLVLDGFIAYGIATHRILAAPLVLQRGVSYVFVACYLVLLYVASQWAAFKLFVPLLENADYIAHLLAGLTLAISVAPARGWMQAVAHSLLPGAKPLNVDEVLKQAADIFQEVSSEDNLTNRFSQLIQSTYVTRTVTVLRPGRDGLYDQRFPPSGAERENPRIEPASPLMRLLKHEHEPVTTEMLQRMRPSALIRSARTQLEALKASAIAGCFVRKEIKAVLLLSEKKDGRIYDLHDQRLLQLLCDQFAVSLENSNLYTTIQNANIYNDILLDSLTSGIVAINAQRFVTVFNKRAQELTGLAESDVMNRPMAVLPSALHERLEAILETGSGFRDRDIFLRMANGNLPLRVSGALFHSHTNRLLGALITFADMTELKQMEEQVRRSDRLASIGTLSAGMAHEIKNPLVTIKTFTELLPDQYGDDEFRQTFFELVGQETKRIDSIVNRLLNFARPARVNLSPVSLHDVVNGALKLFSQQLERGGIVLERFLAAERSIINADADQLNQALINFFLNAMQAMQEGGTLTVRTSLIRFSPDTPQLDGLRNGTYIQLDIEDTGQGIPPENLDRIFDPFFTTKEHGAGLGLPVSYGIIREHDGNIHVESKPKQGTVFHIQFPI